MGGRNIRNPEDLKGKRLGVQSIGRQRLEKSAFYRQLLCRGEEISDLPDKPLIVWNLIGSTFAVRFQ